jgi:hypothetical protein
VLVRYALTVIHDVRRVGSWLHTLFFTSNPWLHRTFECLCVGRLSAFCRRVVSSSYCRSLKE